MSRIFTVHRFLDLFGPANGFTIGLAAVAAVLLSAVVRLLLPLLPAVPVPVASLVYLGVGLLVVECLAYWYAASTLTGGDVLSTVFGVGLAFLVRIIAGLGIAMLVGRDGDVEHQLLFDCVTRVLLIAIGVTVLRVPFRELLESHFGTLPLKRHHVATQKPVHFAFQAPSRMPVRKAGKTGGRLPQAAGTLPAPVPSPAPSAPSAMLAPPAYFVPQASAPDVHGSVTIPRDVILASVPEATACLAPGMQIRVKMGHLVSQLGYPSAWFKWEAFVEALDLRQPGAPDAAPPQAPRLHGRWVRIPACCFVLQVPREHFDRATRPHAWMKLPPVPQEEQFAFDAPEGRV